MFQLVRLDGARRHEAIAVTVGQRLGRHPNCEVTLDDPSVSRLHARIEERAGAWLLVDADSRNGLWMGGVRVREVELVPGAELAIGKLDFKVEALAAATPEAATRSAGDAPLDEELDFAGDLDLDAPPRAPAASTAEGIGLTLEGPDDIELEASSKQRRTPPAAEPAPEADPSARERFLADATRSRAGLLRGDLTQQPAWVQGLVWLAVIAGTGAIAWGLLQLFS